MSNQDDQVVHAVVTRIDIAINDNRRHERIIVGVLVSLFVVGLGLVVYGAAIERWELLVPGGTLQLMIAFPVRQLIRLRSDNMRLQILPELMRLADTREAKRLAAKLVNHLIEQV